MTIWSMRRRHDAERNAAEYVSGELSGRARRWFERLGLIHRPSGSG